MLKLAKKMREELFTLFDDPTTIDQLAQEVIGRDAEMELFNAKYRGPIQSFRITWRERHFINGIIEPIPYMYCDLEWMAEKRTFLNGKYLSEKEQQWVLFPNTNLFTIPLNDLFIPDRMDNGSYEITAPNHTFGITIYPSGDNLPKPTN